MPSFSAIPPTNRTALLWKLNDAVIAVVFQYPGETVTYNITVEGTNAPTSPTATVYKGRSDVTSTVMPSGSHSASGQVITLKPVTALVSGVEYSVMVTATVAGNTEQRKLIIICADDKGT